MSTNTTFDSMRQFGSKPKTVRLAAPEDVIREVKHWNDEDMGLPIMKRGEPVRVELELKPGAQFMEFTIRPLTMAEREAAESIMDTALPPRAFIDSPPERPGQEPRRVPAGYDYDDPVYQAALRPLLDLQAAYVALCGVVGLRDGTPGSTDKEQARSIVDAMPQRMIKFLAGAIWGMTYAQGDPLDFFTRPVSGPSPSSEPSPSPKPPAKKRK
jgi:hypothetical protein